jgi:hypothetical protein
MNNLSLLNKSFLDNIENYSLEFRGAKPFPYICIDQIFEQKFADDLHDSFPTIDESYGRQERASTKPSPNRGISNREEYPAAFQELDKVVTSPEF